MSRHIHLHEHPERFIVGTVGLPGERTFFLQARTGNVLTSVALEKSQVSVLADRIDQLLDEVAATRDASIPPRGSLSGDLSPLEAPIVEEFRVGAMSLGWDDSAHRVVVEAHAIADEDQTLPDITDDSEGPDTLRVWLDADQARAFAERSRSVVSAGRPPCPLCLQPLDAQGHICPRANGYRRRA
ncbi:MAG: DUF3090 domain-containing protein [Actinomycetes bacterium]|jgi:uncharacterized repeat protein (TIGR03847 family)